MCETFKQETKKILTSEQLKDSKIRFKEVQI